MFVGPNALKSQNTNTPETGLKDEIYSKCVQVLESENPDSIKNYFHLFKQYKIAETGDTSFKNLPNLYFKAGKIMAEASQKKETVEFYYEAALLYTSYYGEGVPLASISLREIGDYLFDVKEFKNAINYYQVVAENNSNSFDFS